MPDDLRQRTLAARTAGPLRQAEGAVSLERDDVVVQGQIAVRAAEHLDRGGQLPARLARQRLDPTKDLDALVGDPALAPPALGHARPLLLLETICTARARRHRRRTGAWARS